MTVEAVKQAASPALPASYEYYLKRASEATKDCSGGLGK